MRCVYNIIYLNTLSIRFNNEEKEKMCTDFIILLGINDLRTFSEEVRKERKSIKNMLNSPYFMRNQRFKDFMV